MITEAENIILNKQYFELTADELATVSELVQNAEEFEEMKWFLTSTQEALAGEKVEATPELRKKVMEHLDQPKAKRRFWLNGVIPFLLPEDKKFYQKPAFQMSFAALLVIGFILLMPGKIGEDQLAMNDKESGLKEFDKVGGETEATEMIDEVVPAQELANTRTEDQLDFVVEEVEMEENAEELKSEVDEISTTTIADHDGFYNGPITDADRKRMEESKKTTAGNTNTTGAITPNDVTVAPGTNNVNNPELAPVVTSSDIRGDFGSSDNKDVKGKKYRDANKDKLAKNAEKKERFDTYNDDEVVMDVPANNEQIAVGGALLKEDLNQMAVTDSTSNYRWDSEKDQVSKPNEIRPYKLHVNETKELKSLFTTFK
ncbi:MAG: hypothetical protein ABJG68_17150 [Crocinitomicaceae bacterium]